MSNSKTKKSDQWVKLQIKANNTIDGVGFPIDDQIKELVIGLWANNIPTFSSCQGHFDRGDGVPFVGVGQSPTREELIGVVKPMTIDEIFERFPKLNTIKKNNTHVQLEILNLLNEYYKTHSAMADDRLILAPYGIYGVANLKNQGIEIQHLSSKEKRIKMEQYLGEVDNFAKFLKNKFFDFSL